MTRGPQPFTWRGEIAGFLFLLFLAVTFGVVVWEAISMFGGPDDWAPTTTSTTYIRE